MDLEVASAFPHDLTRMELVTLETQVGSLHHDRRTKCRRKNLDPCIYRNTSRQMARIDGEDDGFREQVEIGTQATPARLPAVPWVTVSKHLEG